MYLKPQKQKASVRNNTPGAFLSGFSIAGNVMRLLWKSLSSFGNLINPKNTLTDATNALSQLCLSLINNPKLQYQAVRVRVNKFL